MHFRLRHGYGGQRTQNVREMATLAKTAKAFNVPRQARDRQEPQISFFEAAPQDVAEKSSKEF